MRIKKTKEADLSQKQISFIDFYCNPESPTFDNATQSALRAGYGANYATKITAIGNGWIREPIRHRAGMLVKAERNLNNILDLETMDEGKENPHLLKTKADISKFVAERLGKDVYGSNALPMSTNTTLIQININPPNAKNTGHKPDRKTVSGLDGTTESQDS